MGCSGDFPAMELMKRRVKCVNHLMVFSMVILKGKYLNRGDFASKIDPADSELEISADEKFKATGLGGTRMSPFKMGWKSMVRLRLPYSRSQIPKYIEVKLGFLETAGIS